MIIPLGEKFRFGIGAYGVAGMGVDYPANLYSGVTYTSYSQMRFAPGLSYKINDMVSVGAVVNIMYATMEFNAASATSQLPHMGASSLGYGATIGVLVKPTDMIQIGLAYETKSYFQDFAFNTAAGEDKIEFNQPQTATIGLGIKPIKDLLIGFDVQWIRWSETNGQTCPNIRPTPVRPCPGIWIGATSLSIKLVFSTPLIRWWCCEPVITMVKCLSIVIARLKILLSPLFPSITLPQVLELISTSSSRLILAACIHRQQKLPALI